MTLEAVVSNNIHAPAAGMYFAFLVHALPDERTLVESMLSHA